jgi:hypothetical protein
MPRFLIKRNWGNVDEATMAVNGRRSREIREAEFPEIVWEHSHVVVDPDGNVVSFCVYKADGMDVLMKHSRQLGDHFVDEVHEISGDIGPEDFPPLPDADRGP